MGCMPPNGITLDAEGSGDVVQAGAGHARKLNPRPLDVPADRTASLGDLSRHRILSCKKVSQFAVRVTFPSMSTAGIASA